MSIVLCKDLIPKENLKIKNLILKEHLKVKLENKKSSIGSEIMEEEYGFKKKSPTRVTALTSSAPPRGHRRSEPLGLRPGPVPGSGFLVLLSHGLWARDAVSGQHPDGLGSHCRSLPVSPASHSHWHRTTRLRYYLLCYFPLYSPLKMCFFPHPYPAHPLMDIIDFNLS